MRPKSVDTPVLLAIASSSIVVEPLGVICVMGSWNYPLMTTLTPLVDVIAAGNCAVVKPSEMSPNCSRWIADFIQSNFDPDLVKCVEG